MDWNDEYPMEPGLYLWKQTGSIALVRVPRFSYGLPIGMVVMGCDFYNRCELNKWGGQWFGPIPN